MGFSQALSGLNASSSNLNVIGNNIANSQTVGFKSSNAVFADVFAGAKIGAGVSVSSVVQNFGAATSKVPAVRWIWRSVARASSSSARVARWCIRATAS